MSHARLVGLDVNAPVAVKISVLTVLVVLNTRQRVTAQARAGLPTQGRLLLQTQWTRSLAQQISSPLPLTSRSACPAELVVIVHVTRLAIWDRISSRLKVIQSANLHTPASTTQMASFQRSPILLAISVSMWTATPAPHALSTNNVVRRLQKRARLTLTLWKIGQVVPVSHGEKSKTVAQLVLRHAKHPSTGILTPEHASQTVLTRGVRGESVIQLQVNSQYASPGNGLAVFPLPRVKNAHPAVFAMA